MPTVTTGTFFLTRHKPVEHDTTPDGNFRLTLRAIDRQGPGRSEPYVLTWTGPQAALWFNEHQAELQPGRGLVLEVHNPRSMPGRVAPETHASVARCQLAALPPSWLAHGAGNHNSAAAAA
jgi:hypothetical protein